ncbi:MAG: serpin family protein [Lentisphaerae bacterium]|nr:serpin family protein [Lentisphaerota bacterium]
MKKNVCRIILLYSLMALMIVSVVLLGNTSQDTVEPQLGPEVAAVYAAVQSELVEGNTTFALNLYRALSQEGGNLFFSPYSISLALAMTYAGARRETETQMKETLHFALPQRVLHPAFHGLDTDLMQRASDVEGVQLSIANALWGQNGYPFLSDFRDTLAESYDAPLRLTGFADASEEARTEINDWVSDATNGKIEDLMKPGSITPLTRLVLANAIYFKGTWKVQFDANRTEPAPFHRLDGSQVKVPMMRMREHFPYTEGRNYQAIELPYTGDALSMVILLPRAGMFEDFEADLSIERLDAILAQMYPGKVQLAMPRFELTSEFSLADTLAQLGMPDAFTGAADFSGMDGTSDLFIGCVAHKAYVSVNEEGTETAAATGVSMTLSMPSMMTIDHPFFFLIRDIETGTILFMGRVMDPS